MLYVVMWSLATFATLTVEETDTKTIGKSKIRSCKTFTVVR